MDLILKFADTSFTMSTSFSDDTNGVAGSLYGVNYRLSAKHDIQRSGILAVENTAWDHMYKHVSKLKVWTKTRIPMYIPSTSGLKELHPAPGSTAIIGATASGKTTTMLNGLYPFLAKVPSSETVILSYGEDYVPGSVDLGQPVELFVEMASMILRQLARFYKVDGKDIDLTDSDHIKLLNKSYSADEFSETFGLPVVPLPTIFFLESIRDFVYTAGVLGTGGFNMRIAIESTHMRKLFEKINIYMFFTINPLLDIKQKSELQKLADDMDSSVSNVLLQLPGVRRESEPAVVVYGRGPGNPDRDSFEIKMRNLIKEPVTNEEILDALNVDLKVEVSSNDTSNSEEEISWTESTFMSRASANTTKMAKLFSQNLNEAGQSITKGDDFLDLVNTQKNK